MNRWYVAYTQANKELEALNHLTRQGFKAYLPRHLKLRRHARKTDWVPRPLFPRYLFIKMDQSMVAWRAINSTRGVVNLICHGSEPATLPRGLVEEIRSREDKEGWVRPDISGTFNKGDRVQVTEGAMCNQIGLFQGATDGDRVVILFKLLGRELKLKLPGDLIWSPT